MASHDLTHRKPEDVMVAEQSRRSYFPDVDILETSEELLLLADLPGVSSGGLDVHFEKDVLSIAGRVQDRHPQPRYLLREYGVGDFYRSFRISEGIDSENIVAELRDGVLTLRLPKVEAARPRKINIQVK
ncbi:MAG: Hsp20/alpha crystallin family protein [Planctomycetota bacterium]